MANISATELARLQAIAASVEAASLATNGVQGASAPSAPTVDGIVMLPVAPVAAKAASNAMADNSIPLGGGKLIVSGKCETASHKSYFGKPFSCYLIGKCGDHGMAVAHKQCADGVKSGERTRGCGSRVFKVIQPDGRTGCATCAKASRKSMS